MKCKKYEMQKAEVSCLGIHYDTFRPIYEQIIEYVVKKLASGKLEAGDKLPSQRNLAQELNVNPNTVQRAYREMELQGLVETKRGLGTFVTESEARIREISQELSQNIITEFVEQMRFLGYEDCEISSRLEKTLNQDQ